MPLTARVESGQSSPSLSTGGGVTAAVGVGVGGGACGAGGSTGDLTSGFCPAAGSGRRACGGLPHGLGIAGDVGDDHDHDGDDDDEDKRRNTDREHAAPPVDLGWQRALRFEI